MKDVTIRTDMVDYTFSQTSNLVPCYLQEKSCSLLQVAKLEAKKSVECCGD